MKIDAREWTYRRFWIGPLGLALWLALSCAIWPVEARAADEEPPEIITAAWVQVTPVAPDGTAGRLLRAVVPQGAACPTAMLGEALMPMRERRLPPEFAGTFPAKVCERLLKPDDKVRLADWALPPLPQDPQRILVIGDSGCRLKGDMLQRCDDPKAWPFAQVAAAAAALAPDLVIHVGDYLYREFTTGNPSYGCNDSPCGDTYAAWRADFLTPAEPLLRAAPWVAVRGNHESCSRGGNGWHLLLNPMATQQAEIGPCPTEQRPYFLRLAPDVLTLVLDTSAYYFYLPAYEKERLAAHYQTVITRLRSGALRLTDAPPTLWTLAHHPFWSFPFPSDAGASDTPPRANDYPGPITVLRHGLGRLSRDRVLPRTSLVLSAHIDMLQALRGSASSGLPWQIISGAGGTSLEPASHFTYLDQAADRPLIVSDTPGVVSGRVTFGFMMLVRDGQTWRADFHDQTGRRFRSCQLTATGLCADR